MIEFLRPAEPFGAQTLRLVAEAEVGGGDLFEIADLMRTLTAGDVNGWIAGWLALAERVDAEAVAAEAAGHHVTARERSFHASAYFRQSDVFTPGGDPRRAPAFRRAQTSFRRAARLHAPEIRTVAVRDGDATYDGYLCLPQVPVGTTVPVVFLIGGADSYAEENYFSGRGIVERGMALLLLDTPGRGSAIYLNDLPARFDYEVPVRAAFDWLEAQPEIDAGRMALAGISLGGYYAPRAAAFEPRAKALAVWSGITSLLSDIYAFFPPIQPQLRWIIGASDDATARTMLAEYDLTAIAPQIAVPTFVAHGRNDRIMDVRGAERFFALLGGAVEKTLRISEGPGEMHCSYDDWRHAAAEMFDWLGDQLSAV
jgi:dipeptidyl aminopeptidase/acylaminoacyl peptidase